MKYQTYTTSNYKLTYTNERELLYLDIIQGLLDQITK